MRILEKTFQDVRVDLCEGLETIYANYVVARYSRDRFALDFVQIMPRARVHRVKARVSMTLQDARLLAGGLRAGAVSVRREQSKRAARGGGDVGQDAPGPQGADAGSSQWPELRGGGQQVNGRVLRPWVSVPCDLATTSSNLVVLTTTPTETVLEFANAVPGYYSVSVSARVILAEGGVRILRDALEGGLSAHASEHGTSSSACGTELVPALRTPANWGGWLPFAVN